MTAVGWSMVFLVLLALALAFLPQRLYRHRQKFVQAAVACFVVFTVGVVLFSVGALCRPNNRFRGAAPGCVRGGR